MSTLQILILSLIQGITEFLPISSSGHLILLPALTGMGDQGTLMDVAVHVGTLVAVLLYFREDTKGLTLAVFATVGISPARKALEGTVYLRLFRLLVLASVPVILVGLFLSVTGLVSALRSATIIASTSIIFGMLLYWADKTFPSGRELDGMTVRGALIIGLSQVLSLIPGTSRSGITMTAGRALGFKRTDAARFSMLMSIPTIMGAGVLSVFELSADTSILAWNDALMGAALACLSALAAIHFLMRWLATANMTIFVVYRVGLGAVLFALIAAGII